MSALEAALTSDASPLSTRRSTGRRQGGLPAVVDDGDTSGSDMPEATPHVAWLLSLAPHLRTVVPRVCAVQSPHSGAEASRGYGGGGAPLIRRPLSGSLLRAGSGSVAFPWTAASSRRRGGGGGAPSAEVGTNRRWASATPHPPPASSSSSSPFATDSDIGGQQASAPALMGKLVVPEQPVAVPEQLAEAWRALMASLGFCQRLSRAVISRQRRQDQAAATSSSLKHSKPPPSTSNTAYDDEGRSGPAAAVVEQTEPTAADSWLRLLDVFIDRLKALEGQEAERQQGGRPGDDPRQRQQAGGQPADPLCCELHEDPAATAAARLALRHTYAVFVEEVVGRMAELLPLAQVCGGWGGKGGEGAWLSCCPWHKCGEWGGACILR